jgi:hypothetical protein
LALRAPEIYKKSYVREKLVFQRGFCDFVVFFDGEIVVGLWCVVAQTWCLSNDFSALKNTPTF